MADPDRVTSTHRLGLEPAPDGLSVAQDLLNTAPVPTSGVPDLLEDLATARRSLEASLGLWAERTGAGVPDVTLAAPDLALLRELRDELRGWLLDPSQGVGPTATIAVGLGHGGVTYEPTGAGAERVAALVVAELLIASRTGRLRRLKTCANRACGAAFYDGSPGASRVWHDVKACGNAANLRASRARRRAASA